VQDMIHELHAVESAEKKKLSQRTIVHIGGASAANRVQIQPALDTGWGRGVPPLGSSGNPPALSHECGVECGRAG
jgi:hypothetical protein